MLYLPMLILAAVQAVAEFLPVSSSGHLLIIQNTSLYRKVLNNLSPETEMLINICLHLATLLAVLIYMRKDVFSILSGFFRNTAAGNFSAPEVLTVRNICIATVPAGVAGIIAGSLFKAVYTSLFPVFIFLIINGIILISSKKIPRGSRKLEEMGIIRSVMTGLFQMVAILPGISRSGMTITGGLISGLSPNDAARFSFLMAVPVIAGAGILEIRNAEPGDFPSELLLPLLVSMVIAVLISLSSLKLLFALVKQVRIDVFGIYTVLAGTAGIICLILKD